MKLIKNFSVALTALVVGISLLATPSVQAAADPSGIFTLPGVSGSDFDSPIMTSKSRLNGALPATVAVSSLGWFSNVTGRVVRDADLEVTLLYSGASITNATPSNQVLYVDVSPDGRIWATNSPLTASFTPVGGVGAARFHFIATNLGANAYWRIRGVTNPGSTGNGSLILSNVVVTSWRPHTERR